MSQEDGRVTVHSFSERAPIPTFLKKLPVCLTYAFCEIVGQSDPYLQPGHAGPQSRPPDQGKQLIVFSDPTNLEERVRETLERLGDLFCTLGNVISIFSIIDGA